MLNDLMNRAVSLHQGGRLGEAEPLYRQLLAAGVDDPQLHFMYGVLLYQQQRFGDALTAVDKSLRRNADFIDALGLKSALLQTLNRPGEALETLRRLTARAPGQPDGWYNLGVCLIALDRLEEAITALDRAIALQPNPMALTNRGSALQRLGRLDEALASTDRALQLAPGYPMALHNRGVMLRALGRPAEAAQAFDGFLAADPRAADVWVERGGALFEAERFADAVESYERGLALEPGSARAWTDRGSALHAIGRYDDAIVSFDKALSLDAGQRQAWCGRGLASNKIRLYAQALESFDRAAALSDAPDLHADRAFTLFRLRRMDEALAAYDLALADAPDNPDYWLDRGVVLTTVQRFDEAMAALDRTLALSPGNANALLAKGKLFCELGRFGEGLDLLRDRAAQRYDGPLPVSDQPHKQKHDAEQAAHQAAHGIVTGRFHIEGGERVDGPVVNPANRELVAQTWAQSDPKIVVIDNLLTEEGLAALRRFALGSTVWTKPYRQGYLGAFVENGFACPLLAQIAEELREVFPTVVEDHGLVNTWGFKYDSTLGGIRIHADQAAVNVNFWITPDEANLNPQSGGMVIWDAVAPSDWEIERYNGDDDAVRAYLAEVESKAITVPYRANRAVIFDSDLFHETDRIEFAEGYLNRRINVTMLYGRRTFINN